MCLLLTHLWGSTVLPVWSFKIQTVPSFLFVWLFLKFNKVQNEQKSELTGCARVGVLVVMNATVSCVQLAVAVALALPAQPWWLL